MKSGDGVVVGDAVGPVLDGAGLAVQWERPTTDIDTLAMGMSDEFQVAIEVGATSARIGHAVSGHLA